MMSVLVTPPSSGRKSIIIAALVWFLAICASFGLIAFLQAPSIVVAVAISLTSFACFTYLAFLFRSSRAWRAVDYPWTLATFVSILVALANISDSDTVNERRAAFVDMMFDMRAIETNECHPDPERLQYYTPNPAPNPQECGRIAHLIDQVERDFFNEIAQPTKPRATGWGAEFPHLAGSQGYWSGLYHDALNFDAVEKKDVPQLEQIGRDRTGPLTHFARSVNLKYWYFVLAFALGLRLARVNADLLAAYRPK
jgi:hypothetical protein